MAIERRSFLQALATLPFVPPALFAENATHDVAVVPSSADRTGKFHEGMLGNTLAFKVLSAETHNGLFIMENIKMKKGGPPRHLHYEVDEFFYLVEGGEVALEIGDEKLRLRPGDCVLAPRLIPHVWAYLSETPGKMIVLFAPAGRMEAFFRETTKPGARPPDAALMEAHGMKLVGPPLLGS